MTFSDKIMILSTRSKEIVACQNTVSGRLHCAYTYEAEQPTTASKQKEEGNTEVSCPDVGSTVTIFDPSRASIQRVAGVLIYKAVGLRCQLFSRMNQLFCIPQIVFLGILKALFSSQNGSKNRNFDPFLMLKSAHSPWPQGPRVKRCFDRPMLHLDGGVKSTPNLRWI
jgi:hypothetical protein